MTTGTKRPFLEEDHTVLLASNEFGAPEIVVSKALLVGSALEKRIERDAPDYYVCDGERGVWRTSLSLATLRAVVESLAVGYLVVGHGASFESLNAAFDFLQLQFTATVPRPADLVSQKSRYHRSADGRLEQQDVLVRKLALRLANEASLAPRLFSREHADGSAERLPSSLLGLCFGADYQENLVHLESGNVDAAISYNAAGELLSAHRDTRLFSQTCQSSVISKARRLHDCSRILVEFLPNTVAGQANAALAPRFHLSEWLEDGSAVEELARAPVHSLDDFLSLSVYNAVAAFLNAAVRLTNHKPGTDLDSPDGIKITWAAVFGCPKKAKSTQTRFIEIGDFERVKEVVLRSCGLEAGDEAGWLFKHSLGDSLHSLYGRMRWFGLRIRRPRVGVSTATSPAEVQSSTKWHRDNELAEHAFCVEMLRFCCKVVSEEADWNRLLSNEFADEEGGESTPARTKLARELQQCGIRVVRWKTVFSASTPGAYNPGPVYFPPFLDRPDNHKSFPGMRTQALLEWIPSAARDAGEHTEIV